MGSRPSSAKSAPGRRRRPASAASFRSARVGGTGGGHVTGTSPASHPSFRLTDVSSHQAHVKTEIARHTSTSAEADLSAVRVTGGRGRVCFAADSLLRCQVKELELTDEVEFDTREVADLLRKHLSLRCLSLARSYVTDEVMDIVAETCPLLDELNLTSTFPLTAAAVARAVAQCPRLRVVHLSKCDHMFSDDEAAATLLAAIAHPASVRTACMLCRTCTHGRLLHVLVVAACTRSSAQQESNVERHCVAWVASCPTTGRPVHSPYGGVIEDQRRW